VTAAIISLAAYRRAATTPAEPLDPEPGAIVAELELDWQRARAAAPDETTARLWWLSQVLDDLAEHEEPGRACRIMSSVVLSQVMEIVSGRSGR
jgi:hypothetical protein